ncbi:MAG: PfkB family carbohydrate kinase [Chloroflexota bacterium]|jgi:sugar/nucleoside kinase (ribokinase family)
MQIYPLQPVDYLVIGHLTRDLTPQGARLGGSAAYSGLTAAALGLKVGVVTACDADLPLHDLEALSIAARYCETTTTFKNMQTPGRRIQQVFHPAVNIDLSMIPEVWRNTPIIHLGPVMQEVDPKLSRAFPSSFIGVTPQGWLRAAAPDGSVVFSEWYEARYVLETANAAVLSIEDVHNSEDIIEEMASAVRVLAVTEAANGVRIYWNGDVRSFRAPPSNELDPTGAGDIFAAAFFIRLQQTRDPWEAARFANHLAAASVNRPGLQGIPTQEEIKSSLVEILP